MKEEILMAVFIALGLVGIYFGFTYIGAILYFTTFDVIGFFYITPSEEIKFYRILQISQMILLSFLLGDHLIGWWFAWWFGACDMLYYVLLNQLDAFKSKDMYWLWWTPYGLINRLFGLKTKGYELLVFGILGLVFGYFI